MHPTSVPPEREPGRNLGRHSSCWRSLEASRLGCVLLLVTDVPATLGGADFTPDTIVSTTTKLLPCAGSRHRRRVGAQCAAPAFGRKLVIGSGCPCRRRCKRRRVAGRDPVRRNDPYSLF